MSLTVNQCLEIKGGEWVEFEHNGEHTLIPKDYYNPAEWGHSEDCSYTYSGSGGVQGTKNTELCEGWCFRWYDSGKWCLTDNQWTGCYKTQQECFDDAFAELLDDSIEDNDEFKKHLQEWMDYATDNDLNDKVVTITWNGI